MQKLSSSAVLSIIGVLICTTLVACKSGDSKLPPQAVERPVAQGLQGVWNAPAYGMVLSVTDTEHVFYQTTSDYCQIFDFDMVLDMDFDEVLASMQLSSDQSSILMSFAGAKSPGMVMNRQTELPGNCVTNLLKQSTDVGYEFDAERDFNIFWQTFNEHYAFFHLEGIDWNEVYQQASGSISGSTTEAELFEILSEMVAPLKDFHVQLGNEELDEEFSVNRKPGITEIVFQEFIEINAIEPPLSEQQYQQFFQYYGQQYDRWLEVLVDHFDEDAEGFSNDSETINWGMLQDDLGYILIDTMTAEVIGESDSYEQNLQILSNTLDEIFEYFQLVDGLVIDIRNNGGGNDSVSQAIVSRMIEQALPIYSKQARLAAGRTPLQHVIVQPQGSVRFTGPVALLISETTSSAAEIFALAMRERENTILIGEASGGGFSDILPKSLPHELNYTLSNEYYVSVDGEEFEGLGVPVDIEQPFFTLQQREEGVDPGLDSAIVWLNDQD